MQEFNIREKESSYPASSSYSTLNSLGPNTKTVWIVFHGIGYLSRYFLKYFEDLPTEENYIIAPQAPSKYYLNDTYTHVGASWLTKENTMSEIRNVLQFLDSIMAQESLPDDCQINILGFSQGVSIALRWVCHSHIKCDKLILYAGGIPNELKTEDTAFLMQNTEISIVFGKRDAFLTVERMVAEEEKIERLFRGQVKRVDFEGGHEMLPEVLNQFVD
ncbi:MAG: esterase [Flavobacteriaceae bacterium]|nr:esterase [Flavobacteriaceae bacterium]